MYTKDTVVRNRSGIHARPASTFVKEASKFHSSITIANLDKPNTVPASTRSILNVMMLAMTKGTHVRLSAEGEDEQLAVDTLVALIDSGLGEGIE